MPETIEALSPFALITLDDIKIELGVALTEAAFDARLTRILNAVTDAAERYMQRPILSRTYHVRANGTGTRYFEPVSVPWPITKVLGIWVNELAETPVVIQDDAPTTDPLTAAVLVPAGRRGFVRLSVWPEGVGNIRLQVHAGYNDADGVAGAVLAPLPQDIRLGAIICAREWWRLPNQQRQGVESISAGGQTVSFRDAKIPPEARELWDVYIRASSTG